MEIGIDLEKGPPPRGQIELYIIAARTACFGMIGLWRIANEICIKFIIHLAYTGANDVIYAPRWMYNIFVTSCFLAQIHSLSSYIFICTEQQKSIHTKGLFLFLLNYYYRITSRVDFQEDVHGA